MRKEGEAESSHEGDDGNTDPAQHFSLITRQCKASLRRRWVLELKKDDEGSDTGDAEVRLEEEDGDNPMRRWSRGQ